MNSQTRLLNLLNFQANSSGKTENFISNGSRRAGSRTGSLLPIKTGILDLWNALSALLGLAG